MKPRVADVNHSRRPGRHFRYSVYVCYCHPEDRKYRDLLLAWDAEPDVEFDFRLASPLREIPSDDPDVIESVLLRGMAGADCMLVIVGMTTKNNVWVNWELQTAHKRGMPIIAVKLRRTLRGPPKLYGVGAKFVVGFRRDTILEALRATYGTHGGPHPAAGPDIQPPRPFPTGPGHISPAAPA